MISVFLVFIATIKDHWDVRNEEVLKFCRDGICTILTSVTRSQGGTGGLGGLCQPLSLGACVKALTSPQRSTRYPVYSSGLALHIFRAHVAFLRCLFVRGTAHTSLFLAVHSLLPEVKCCIIYISGSVACILFEG